MAFTLEEMKTFMSYWDDVACVICSGEVKGLIAQIEAAQKDQLSL